MNPDGSVSADGKSTMSGYTIIKADSMEAALAAAKACPFLEIGGSLEVSELVAMPGTKWITESNGTARLQCDC